MVPPSSQLIDVHTHVVPAELPVFDDRFWPTMHQDGPATRSLRFPHGGKRSLTPPAWDVGARLEDMDSLGVTRHIVSPMPALLADVVTSPRSAQHAADCVNDAVAGFVDACPERFGGFGTLPVASKERVLACIARGAGGLGLDGFEVSTEGLSRFLDDGIWDEVFHSVMSAGAWLFIHPHDHTIADRRAIVGRLAVAGVGMTTETALAAVDLMRLAQADDDSRILLAHGGGTLPYLLPRLDQLWESTVARSELSVPPSEAFATSFYVDTCVHGPASLRCVASAVPSTHLLYGSDYPFALHVPADHIRDTFDDALANDVLSRHAERAGLGPAGTRDGGGADDVAAP